jgi:hypothetical protein
VAVRPWREAESAQAPVWGDRLKRAAQSVFMIFVGATMIYCMTLFLVLGNDREVMEAAKKIDVSYTKLLTSLMTSIVLVTAVTHMVVRWARRDRPRRSTALTITERWIFAWRDRRFRHKRREREMDSWRSQIVRETYQQVMEQQERGLLCPNCKGQDPGHRKTA